MFGLMKTKNPYEQAAHDVYAAVLGHSRDAAFYTDLAVEDTLEGRFELLALHVFAIMHVVLSDNGDEVFNQALFDIMFADIDQALRQMGKGDMGVPKHMRRMMKGFNGLTNAYEEAYSDKKAFEEAIRRNLYAGNKKAPADKMVAYVRRVVKQQSCPDILEGKVKLPKVKK